jgi:hypothetical protein
MRALLKCILAVIALAASWPAQPKETLSVNRCIRGGPKGVS